MKLPRGHHLSPEELAGQLLMPAVRPEFWNRHSPAARHLLQFIHRYGVGGFVFLGGHPAEIRFWTELLRRESRYPLLFAAPLDQGMRLPFSGCTPFPHALAFGAAGDESLLRGSAEALGREARSMGIQLLLGPVLDLADLPTSPDAHVRSWHREPRVVARFGEVFVRTIQEMGIACVARHFPGQGSTQFPIREQLTPVIKSPGVIQKEDLFPFEAVIRQGVQGILVGHLLVDGFNQPASLAAEWIQHFLRDQLEFSGVVCTDFLDTPGLQTYFSLEECLFRPVEAGADMLLHPPQFPLAHRLLSERIRRDTRFFQQAARAVDRIFRLKKWLHTRQPGQTHPFRIFKWVGHPGHVGLAHQVAETAVTLVHRSSRFPVDVPGTNHVNHFVFTDQPLHTRPLWTFSREMERIFQKITVYYQPSRETVGQLPLWEADLQVISLEVTGHSIPSRALPWDTIQRLLRSVKDGSTPTLVVVFGNPFVLQQLKPFRPLDAILLTYSNGVVSQRAAARAIASFTDIRGRLPVQLPRSLDQSIALPARSYALAESPCTPPEEWNHWERQIQTALESRLFPGAVILVAHRGKVLWHQAYGKFHFHPQAPEVRCTTCYDLDLLTQPLATALAVAKLLEEHRLHPSDPLVKFYPELKQHPRALITIIDLLAHRSGLPPAGGLPGTPCAPSQWLEYLFQLPPEKPPGEKFQYSAWNYFLLGDIVQRASGVSLETFCRDRLFAPLGLSSLHFRVPDRRYPASPPTLLHGSADDPLTGATFDPLCRLTQGTCGHAGLFGRAVDAAAIGQLLIQKGIYQRMRFLSTSIIALLTRPPEAASPFTPGWERIPSPRSKGRAYQKHLVGATGNTGTAIRVHLKHQIILVLLTNFSLSGRPRESFRDFVDRLFFKIQRRLRTHGS